MMIVRDLPEWLHRFFGGGDIRYSDKQASRKDAARSLIDQQDFSVEFDITKVYAFNELLGTEFDGFKRFINPKFSRDHRHIFALFADGQWRDFSWNKKIAPPSEITRVYATLRSAVWQDLQEALDAITPKVCTRCGLVENLSTDHAAKPFSTIADEWLALNGNPSLVDRAAGGGKQIADINQEASWVTYHAANAEYQILCRSCNSSKGNRGDWRTA